MAMLFAVMGFISTIANGYFCNAVVKVFVFALFYVKVTRIRFRSQDVIGGTKLYVLMSCAISGLIVLSFIFGYPHMESTYYMGRYSIGITGLYKNPNYLSSFINIAYFIVLYVLMYKNNNLKLKVIYVCMLLLFLYSFYLSGTRASLLVAGFTTSVLLLTYTFKSNNKLRAYCAVIFIIAIILYSLESLSLMFDDFLGNRKIGEDEGRILSWNYAFNVLIDSPFLGLGLNGWNIAVNGTSYMEYLHNIFLEMLLDYGFLGFTIFLIMFFSGLRGIKRQDCLFVTLFFFVATFPLLFQNGLTEVNLWRCLLMNRIVVNYSRYSQTGITGLLKSSYA